jgi:hypothetical protein
MTPQTNRSVVYRGVAGEERLPPFVAYGFGFNATDEDAVVAYQKLRKTVADESGIFCGGVTVVDALGRTVLPPRAKHPNDPAGWDLAIASAGGTR